MATFLLRTEVANQTGFFPFPSLSARWREDTLEEMSQAGLYLCSSSGLSLSYPSASASSGEMDLHPVAAEWYIPNLT